MLTQLGTRVRKLRRDRKLTQEELARRAQLDPKHVQAIEAGGTNLTVASLLGLAVALEVSPGSLLDGPRSAAGRSAADSPRA